MYGWIRDAAGARIMKQEFDFWQDHSDTFLTMAYQWERRQRLQNPDGFGRKTGDCGDTVSIYLRVREGTIQEVRFELDGCLNTNACANCLASLVEGKELEQGWAVTPDDLISCLETLPEDHYHCAELAVGTFYLALADYHERATSP